MQPTGEGVSFLEAVQQGTFVIDTVAAGQIKQSIADVRGNVTDQLMQLQYFHRQELQLGDLQEAHAIAKIDTLVATGDQQSLDYVLQRFSEVLDDLHQAVEHCLRQYKQDDAQAARGFPQLDAR